MACDNCKDNLWSNVKLSQVLINKSVWDQQYRIKFRNLFWFHLCFKK